MNNLSNDENENQQGYEWNQPQQQQQHSLPRFGTRNVASDDDTTIRTAADPNTNEVIQLYAQITKSLAADVTAIQQCTDLAEVLGIVVGADGDDRNDDEKHDGNHIRDKKKDQSIVEQQLFELDRYIAGVEHKVSTLRRMVNEEQQAVVHFETDLRAEAQDQQAMLEVVLSTVARKEQHEAAAAAIAAVATRKQAATQQPRRRPTTRRTSDEQDWSYYHRGVNDHHDPETQQQQQQHRYYDPNVFQSNPDNNSNNNDDNNNDNTNANANTNSNKRRVLQSRSLKKHTNQSSPYPSRAVPKSQHDGERCGNMDTVHIDGKDKNEEDEVEQETELCSFVAVTESEIYEQTRNVPSFGLHLSRYDLNEALDAIAQVVRNKLALDPESGGTGNSRASSSNTMQRRAEYLRHRHQHQRGPQSAASSLSNATHAHVGYRWVSEQELRENCAFFRTGEATARATLQLLCSLRRLKQVPGKNRDITYLCLFIGTAI